MERLWTVKKPRLYLEQTVLNVDKKALNSSAADVRLSNTAAGTVKHPTGQLIKSLAARNKKIENKIRIFGRGTS